MLLGIDNGYTYTKTSEGVIFPSRIRRGEALDLNKGNSIEVEIDGISYVVGEQGEYTVEANKIDSELNKVCTLTAIALSSQDDYIETDIVVGLPVEQYKDFKEDFKLSLFKHSSKTIRLNGRERHIKITNVEVFPQGAGPIFTNIERYKDASTLVIDWGGLTVDVCQFEGLKLTKPRTFKDGILTIYGSVVSEINKATHFKTDYKPIQAEKLLRQGYYICDGKKHDTGLVEGILKSYVNSTITNIKQEFPLGNMDYVVLIGGSSILLEKYIKDAIGQDNVTLLNNAQFVNANAFEVVGRMRIYGK